MAGAGLRNWRIMPRDLDLPKGANEADARKIGRAGTDSRRARFRKPGSFLQFVKLMKSLKTGRTGTRYMGREAINRAAGAAQGMGASGPT